MAQLIPVTNNANQVLITTLRNQEVRLRCRWQPSDASWYADLEFPLGTPVISGRRLTAYEFLLDAIPSEFSGDITCSPIGEQVGEPGRNAWGETHNLIYLEL